MTRCLLRISICAIVCAACSSPTGPYGDLEFSALEIQYTRAGGWIDTARLDIHGTGQVRASRIAHASSDTVSRVSDVLTPDERRKIAAIFGWLPTYDPVYEPNPWVTDGNYHILIMRYEGRTDTVRVYEPDRARIPGGLKRIIREMETLWQRLMFPAD